MHLLVGNAPKNGFVNPLSDIHMASVDPATGRGDSRRLRLQDFKTIGKLSALNTGYFYPLIYIHGTHFC